MANIDLSLMVQYWPTMSGNRYTVGSKITLYCLERALLYTSLLNVAIAVIPTENTKRCRHRVSFVDSRRQSLVLLRIFKIFTCVFFFFFLLQIDSSVVGEIDDATMAAYIPAYGDRVAARRFCVEKRSRGGDDQNRLSLFEKIKRKKGTPNNKDKDEDFDEEYSIHPAKAHLKNPASLKLLIEAEGEQLLLALEKNE